MPLFTGSKFGFGKDAAAGGGPPGFEASGGNIEDTSSRAGYKVHIFTTGGAFTVTAGTESCEILMIGGGGGGAGITGGGGGGAGGLLYGNMNLGPGGWSIGIGAGGAAGGNGNPGTNTEFVSPLPPGAPETWTALGGGAGRQHADPSAPAQQGGSGGGGSGVPAGGGFAGGAELQTSYGPNSQPLGTLTGYGNAGGTGYHAPGQHVDGGGGGGAGVSGGHGVAGTWPQPADTNKGGDGKQYSITGTSLYWAGGGGGGGHYVGAVAGNGGNGGGGGGGGYNNHGTGGPGYNAGGNGQTQPPNTGGAGGANTGGGGGGADGTSGPGGTGIVIIAYPY